MFKYCAGNFAVWMLALRAYQISKVQNRSSHVAVKMSGEKLNKMDGAAAKFQSPNSRANDANFLSPVSKAMRVFTDNQRKSLLSKLEEIQLNDKKFVNLENNGQEITCTIHARFPDWTPIMEKFASENTSRLAVFVERMSVYFDDEKMSFHTNPLHDAAAKSDVEFIQLLVDCEIDLSMTNPNGSNAMHFACQQGDVRMINLLIKHLTAQNVTARGSSNATIFHFAAQNPDKEVAPLIFNRFTFENGTDNREENVLHHAASTGPKETVQLLLDQRFGINIDAWSNARNNVLHYACAKNTPEVVHLLLNTLTERQGQTNLTTQNENQEGAIHVAFKRPDPDLAIQLLDQNPDLIAVEGAHGFRAAHYACYHNKIRLLEHILKISLEKDIYISVKECAMITAEHVRTFDIQKIKAEQAWKETLRETFSTFGQMQDYLKLAYKSPADLSRLSRLEAMTQEE